MRIVGAGPAQRPTARISFFAASRRGLAFERAHFSRDPLNDGSPDTNGRSRLVNARAAPQQRSSWRAPSAGCPNHLVIGTEVRLGAAVDAVSVRPLEVLDSRHHEAVERPTARNRTCGGWRASALVYFALPISVSASGGGYFLM
jgi:hypothetical protein